MIQVWFWLLFVFLLLWFAGGAIDFYMDTDRFSIRSLKGGKFPFFRFTLCAVICVIAYVFRDIIVSKTLFGISCWLWFAFWYLGSVWGILMFIGVIETEDSVGFPFIRLFIYLVSCILLYIYMKKRKRDGRKCKDCYLELNPSA